MGVEIDAQRILRHEYLAVHLGVHVFGAPLYVRADAYGLAGVVPVSQQVCITHVGAVVTEILHMESSSLGQWRSAEQIRSHRLTRGVATERHIIDVQCVEYVRQVYIPQIGHQFVVRRIGCRALNGQILVAVIKAQVVHRQSHVAEPYSGRRHTPRLVVDHYLAGVYGNVQVLLALFVAYNVQSEVDGTVLLAALPFPRQQTGHPVVQRMAFNIKMHILGLYRVIGTHLYSHSVCNGRFGGYTHVLYQLAFALNQIRSGHIHVHPVVVDGTV